MASTSQNSTGHSSDSLSQTIKLNIGGKHFEVARTTLIEGSDFFAALFSGRWQSPSANEPYFIDADGELFHHILRYLQRGVFPLFYDRQKGFDYALYLSLCEEAKYFGVMRLCEWIEKEKYLKAVQITCSTKFIEDYREERLRPRPLDFEHSTTEEHSFQMNRYIRKVYVCPRGIAVHRGSPGMCGRQCRNAREGDDEFEDEPVFDVFHVQRKTKFFRDICLESKTIAEEPTATEEVLVESRLLSLLKKVTL